MSRELDCFEWPGAETEKRESASALRFHLPHSSPPPPRPLAPPLSPRRRSRLALERSRLNPQLFPDDVSVTAHNLRRACVGAAVVPRLQTKQEAYVRNSYPEVSTRPFSILLLVVATLALFSFQA